LKNKFRRKIFYAVVTRNDFRELVGLGRDTAPHLDEPMTQSVKKELFKAELDNKDRSRNIIT
jgi:hypothetical protein